jgi:CRP-like cAMP-binding protein
MSLSGGVGLVEQARRSSFAGLNDPHQADVRRLVTFWHRVEHFAPGMTVCNEKSRNIVVVSGWVLEVRLLHDGRRQIFSILLPGDFAKIGASSDLGTRGLLAITNVQIADADILGSSAGDLQISAAIGEAIQQREDRLLDHMVRIGRLTAKERVLNLLLELHDRLNLIGMVKDGTFRVPLTQELFADALGLSVVHINRTLQELRREGLIVVRRGTVTLSDPERLADIAFYRGGPQ